MQQDKEPILKDLVLIGGGHSHAIVLRMFAMKPLPGVRLTLITENSDTPYSGMLPGHIAGFYSHEECHIDLRPLAQFAQAQLYIDRVVNLDLKNNKVICANRPTVDFDVLSVDIGSTPAKISVSEAAEYVIPAKPVSKLLKNWDQLVKTVEEHPQAAISIAIAGGGAGGVELALSMQAHLQQILQHSGALEIHLFQRDRQLMPKHHQSVRQQVQQILIKRGIKLHLGETVSQVAILTQKGNQEVLQIQCESGLTVECNKIFWVTQAAAPEWLKKTELGTDEQGFILVNKTLQSQTHPYVFAAGDIATMVNYRLAKAGVFAVRQGKPLFENLQRYLLGKPLKHYKPQKQYLSLIGTGDGQAITTKGAFTLPPHKLLWRWKDWIDRRFMQRFQNLPEMKQKFQLSTQHSQLSTQIRCAGCGSKVASTVLKQVLYRIQQEQPIGEERKDIIIGLDAPDDAAVVQISTGQLMVQTLDYFSALINDPYIFGQISANHCLSDLFAMGATPHSTLAIASIPYAAPAKLAETLYQLLSGAVKVFNQAGAPLIGGHTSEGADLAFGLTCNGVVEPHKLLRKSGMQPGQVLVLTKALGTGTLFAADMRRQAKGRWIDAAVESMLLSNQAAAICLLEHGVTACTDVTGFGLLGHLMEMVQASGVVVELQLDAIPVLTGATETLAKEIFSSLHPDNLQASNYIHNLIAVESHPHYPLLFDPQTSGGLLAAIPQAQANSCLATLQALGYKQCSIIGSIKLQVVPQQPITLIN
ncbi:MAG: selenide, water dikinase SelD [Aulosira sp. ZfuVER01]|nr:selenide, water dikinase SelD [Aulosira sp. ZfuVER01]MDZ8002985.1 selenide, water dikinase SelD [Aulosira sp. DedVER01a]MDZ8053500.1 selenide, water dikinase SelD [Aulosira sp. ZfuCHP01]